MKILHIITGLDNGGAEGVLYRLITGDDQNNHFVISLMDEGVFGERFVIAGITVHTLYMPRGCVKIKGIIKLYQLIRKIRPDVIQTWMYHADLIGGVVARVARVKAIVWGIRNSNLDDLYTSLSTRFVVKFCALASGWIPRRIIFNSGRSVDFHVEKGYAHHKVVLIPNGFNYVQLSPNNSERVKLRKELGIDQNDVLLGMVARWDPQKDHVNLVAALGLLKSRTDYFVKVILVGPGITNDNSDLVAMLDLYGVTSRVKLIGPRNDISRVMNALDLHILSSRFGEAFPNVLAESMVCGTPCVSTDVGDAALILSNLGWIVLPNDSVSLADAISLALFEKQNEPHAWESRKAACRQRIVENFSLEKMVSAFRQVWNDVSTEVMNSKQN